MSFCDAQHGETPVNVANRSILLLGLQQKKSACCLGQNHLRQVLHGKKVLELEQQRRRRSMMIRQPEALVGSPAGCSSPSGLGGLPVVQLLLKRPQREKFSRSFS